jgi:uncharacterized protein
MSFLLCASFPLNSAFGQQPSFSCVKVTRSDEAAICRDAQLSSLDRQLQDLYKAVREGLGPDDKILLRDTQRLWLQKRAACAASVDCIGDMYKTRISQLKTQLAGPAGPSTKSEPSIAPAAPTATAPAPAPSPGARDACEAFPTLCREQL